MSIQDQIDRIAGAKASLGTYLAKNGVPVPTGATLDEMALKLADVIEKQNKITAAGILKGDGAGGVSAAVPGKDYLGVDDEIQGLRLRGGINSIGSSDKSVAINPAVNGIGFARLSGGIVKVYYDGYEMPITDSYLDSLFDGKLGTYVNFGIPVGDFTWKDSVTYAVGAYVQDKGTSCWYKALKENTNVSPIDDTTGTWAFVSFSQTGNYARFIKLDGVAISIDVTLLSNIRYENSLSLYWRALGQNASYIKVEKYDSNAGWFQVYENDSIPTDETINNIWIQPDPSGAGTQKRFRVTIKSQKGSTWCALSQIAITGLAGGIEGTLVNRGGSTMYGNLSPYKTGAVSLGTESARWNEVHANKFYGDGSDLTNIPYPVTSVNGATGAVKSTFYVTVTQENGDNATADKTAAEVYAAYEAGYAVYAIAKFTGAKVPYTLPLLAAVSVSGTVVLGFATIGSSNSDVNPQGLVVLYNGAAWSAWSDTLAKIQDIPTTLKNPWPLNIKIGNATTSYDGSAAKTVEIPEGGGTDESLGITGAAAGKIPKIKDVDAAGKPTAWEATALPNEAFIVYFTREIQLEGDPILTSDRTPEEVIAAIASKKLVIALLKQNNEVTQLCNISNTVANLYFFTILKDGRAVGIGWNIEADDLGEKTYTLTTMTPLSFITYSGTTAPNQIFGTGDIGGYEFMQHIGFENLPAVTTSDNGKFMRVVNGAWKAAAIDNANGGSF